MDEMDRLLVKRNELEQLIRNKQESLSHNTHNFNGVLSSYVSHPADMAANLQILNIELEKINDALSQYSTEQLI